MDRSKKDLEALVNTQKDQLLRYEKRLKDVVTAYKGLLKEKEALETSLSAVTKDDRRNSLAKLNDEKNLPAQVDPSESSNSLAGAAVNNDQSESESHLQTQIITLMNSLATLSAEKSRMEASFQADKKQLRGQLAQKDHTIAELLDKRREREERAKLEVDEVKAKWILERQEREKETNNQMIMIRELQKLYADERHLKENIEMQLNNFKTQFANNETENARLNDVQNQLREAKTKLKQLEDKGRSINGEEIADNAFIIKQVQLEMQQLKEQHAIAIKNEQRRVLLAEEESRKQAALHEDRVANLESRLAELSSTVGSYDRLRQQDQEAIQALKRKLQELEYNTDSSTYENAESNNANDSFLQHRKLESTASTSCDLSAVIDEIVRLKKLLITENARSTNPIDVSKIFVVVDHTQCQEEINAIQQQYDACKKEVLKLQDKIEVQKAHIATLQEKVKVLNRNIDEQDIELKFQGEKLSNAVKEERGKWKGLMTDLENDCRSKINNLEQQLQKQRQRSLQLLEEKEQEIKTLHTSFEIFQNAALPVTTAAATIHGNAMGADYDSAHAGASSDADSTEGTLTSTNIKVKSKKLSIGENCHMLHYANEIARKDIEIAGLRKAKYTAETTLRKVIHDKVTAQEDLCDKIATLEEEVDRLERCKTREGANLEYLKNVIISFIVTKDMDGKRHMMNAISAVLQFTPNEIQTINAAFQRK